jgi:pyruvate/2-oxoglutarate dehydrogenase complex dihydrolipoamide dehydrogenase (E3) component
LDIYKIPYKVIKKMVSYNDLTIMDDLGIGFIEIYVKVKTGEVLGGTVACNGASEALSQISTLMKTGLQRAELLTAPFPSLSVVFQEIAEEFRNGSSSTIRKIANRKSLN